MASRGVYDLLILHAPDAKEWCQYLFSLFQTHPEGRDFAIHSYELNENEPIQRKSQKKFQNSKCILILLSGDLESNFDDPDVLQSLRSVLRPPHKIIVLFCGVMDKEDFTNIFQDWPHWKQLSSEDEPELYVLRVKDTILDDSGCESSTEPEREQDQSHPEAIQGNLLSIQPERIRCGVKTEIYLIFKCKLDSGIKNEVHFNPSNGPCVRSSATLQNEYILSVDAPDLPSGPVFLKAFSGDLQICDVKITYFTDMEEICQLLDSATSPVEFMCQAFKIMPYNREALDKLLTDSLKNNIPASGLHLFGINQIEEENTIANQRDEELPTLLHFSAKYGLKNLTALLLTCPGALQAYSVSNKHGDFPNNIAEKYGFKDLRQFIDEYVETADMLKTHIKEELMQGDNDDSLYETMVNLSTDILMKCSLHPGSDEDLYETMAGFADDTYIDMRQLEGHDPSLEKHGLTAQDSMLRKILEGGSLGTYDNEFDNNMEGTYQQCGNEDYDTVSSATPSSITPTIRPPIPIPRPEDTSETEPFISQVFSRNIPVPRNENIYMESFWSRTASSIKLKRDRQQSSVYDPFAGMKTPGQRELITLQERVKLGIVSVDEAVLEFKEWQLNQKKRSDSFRYQQENLQRLRDSISRRRDENKKSKNTDIEITRPIRRGQNRRAVQEYGIYEQASSLVPSQVEIRRGNWKTDSTSSTSSSNSNRSSTRSTLSLSSGREGDNEEDLPDELPEERPRYSPRHASLPEERPPPRPPRIQNHSTRRSKMSSSGHNFRAPPVPPRGNN